jgi:hypothetical protein
MKVSTENDDNFGYEKITINMPLNEATFQQQHLHMEYISLS